MDVDVVGRGVGTVAGAVVGAGVLISVWVGLVQPAESAQNTRTAIASKIMVLFMNSPLIFLYF
jgi:hypothetical protein